MTVDWSRWNELMADVNDVVLTCHARPDCDALGSELGLAELLRGQGKRVRIINPDTVPPNLRWMDPDRAIQAVNIDVSVEDAANTDALIVLDTGAWVQLGAMGDVIRKTRGRKLVIDHHPGGDDLGTVDFKDTSSEATGRLIHDLILEQGVAITRAMAEPLWAAITTDTGWFRFPSVNSGTMRAAANLIDAGARPEAIYAKIYEQDSLARLHLLGRVMSRATVELDGRLIYVTVRAEDFAATGALPTETDDLINNTLRVRGTQLALLITESADGRVRVSFRSRTTLDAGKLAGQFGGGGHKAAAGTTLPGPFDEAFQKVLAAAREALRAIA